MSDLEMTAATSEFHTPQPVLLMAHGASDEAAGAARLSANADLGLIGLGLLLLGLGSFVLIARLCRTLTSGGND